MSLQLIVILVPVVFGLMGFAVDLGRLYLIRGELNEAAQSMAVAGAAKLIGTQQSMSDATSTAQQLLDNTTGHAVKYNFGALQIGQTTGLLSSQAPDPGFFSTVADATGTSTLGTQADGATARHIQVNLTADAPLLFWSFLSLGQQRTTSIAALAVAGVSAPVCVACGIEPFAVAAITPDDTTDFGFVAGNRYTFAYQCTAVPPAAPAPAALAGTVVNYLLIDRFDGTSTLDEGQQSYRDGAQGLIPSTTEAQACVSIGNTEAVWGTNSGGTIAQQGNCSANLPSVVVSALCGLYSRLDTALSPPSVCSSITDLSTLAGAYQPDTDVSDLDDYTAYTGNTRRVMTIPIVDSLANPASMTVLGFRQFLLEPNPSDVVTNPADRNARFVALYIGMSPADSNTTPAPVKQGRIDGCQNGAVASQGPGKVVLHQ